jgi:guanine deaminase
VHARQIGATRLRGTLLVPAGPGSVRCIDDGEVVIDGDGRLLVAGEHDARRRGAPAQELDFGAAVVILPGLVDAHVHLPQHAVRGCDPGALLTWLDATIYPAERRFADPEHARQAAGVFEHDLLRLGTTAAGVYVTSHTAATRLALERLRIGGVVGKVLMDRAAPIDLTEPASVAIPALESLIDAYGARTAVVPRFAIGCSEELLRAAGELARRRGASVMTHLAENRDEVAQVAAAFPGAASYTDVYARAGLLGRRTLLAHAVHVDDADCRRLAAAGASVVHCPTANLALGSGRMPVELLRAHGIAHVLGTDVGAGPSLSMWHVIDAYLRVHAGHATIEPAAALWLATRGGALALGEQHGGRLAVGSAADLTVFELPPGARGVDAIVRALAATTRAVPEPPALATWCRGACLHRRS